MVFVPSSAAEKKTARRGRPWRHGVVHVREEDGVLIVVDAAAAKPASGPRDDAAGQEIKDCSVTPERYRAAVPPVRAVVWASPFNVVYCLHLLRTSGLFVSAFRDLVQARVVLVL
jgi:hypothetical protein